MTQLDALVDARFEESVAFLRELVRMPSDTPPGDNTRHAERAAELLQAMGYQVDRHPIPPADVRAAGLVSVTNLIVRRRFGDGPVIAYCRIGERSSLTWFVLKHLLGFQNVKNYYGSWTEWGNLVGAPVEKP